MKLESFILVNSDKSIWKCGEFRYGQILISVRKFATGVFQAILCYPAPYFCYDECFDIRKMNTEEGEKTALHSWIQTTFLPNAEKAFRAKIKKES